MTYRQSTWDADREQLLTDKWLAGEKIDVIAAELGIRTDTVKKKRRRLGLQPRRHEART